MTVLDTNIVILYLKGDHEVVAWVKRRRAKREQFAISTMTVVELLSFPRISSQEVVLIELWLQRVLVVDVDSSIARVAARIRREVKLTTSDSVIAATAVLLKSPVATRDMDFKKIRDVQVLVP